MQLNNQLTTTIKKITINYVFEKGRYKTQTIHWYQVLPKQKPQFKTSTSASKGSIQKLEFRF